MITFFSQSLYQIFSIVMVLEQYLQGLVLLSFFLFLLIIIAESFGEDKTLEVVVVREIVNFENELINVV